MNQPPHDVTVLLARLADGDSAAEAPLAALLYDHLRLAARRHLGPAAQQHTLQPTALVHEVFLKICGRDLAWNDRKHFFAVASRAAISAGRS